MRLVYLAFGWAAGLIFAANITFLPPIVWLIALGASFFFAWQLSNTRFRWWWLALLMFALAGYRYQIVPQTSVISDFNGQGATIEGIIVSELDERDDRTQFQLDAEIIDIGTAIYEVTGRVLVNAPITGDMTYGDRVRVTGALIIPAEYDTFSYSDYLAQQNIYSILDDTIVEIVSSNHGNALFAWTLAIKSRLEDNIAQALPDPQAALLTGILLGNERGISPNLADDFSRTGASHIIAISGFNMAILSGVLMSLFGGRDERRWLAAILSIAVLASYTILVGANAAVVRAAIMSSMLIIADALNRKTYVPASLAFVVIVMSLIQPSVLWSISFQLSFFAVLGLALLVDPLKRTFSTGLEAFLPRNGVRVVIDIIEEPIIVSLAALAFTLPLTILYFQQISIVALLVNLLIVPVQAAILIVGLIALGLSLFLPAIAQILFWLVMILLSWSIGVVRWFSDLSVATVTYRLHPLTVRALYLTVFGVAVMTATRPRWSIRLSRWLRQRMVFNTIILCGIGILLLQGFIWQSRPDGLLHVWWLDIGHSNGVLMQTPNGAHILVDGGRFPSRLLTSIGDRLPFHDRTIELLIITQPDQFDVGAIPALLERYEIGAVMITGQPNQSATWGEIIEAIAPYDVIEAQAGFSVSLDDGTDIEMLHPQTTPSLEDSLADNTLLVRVVYGNASILLTGDLSQSAQREIIEDGHLPYSTVMQLPQHGTARSLSDAFLAIVQPQVAILQGDIANRRGDPDEATLLQLGDIPLYRTDTQGAIHLWSDGNALWLQTQN